MQRDATEHVPLHRRQSCFRAKAGQLLPDDRNLPFDDLGRLLRTELKRSRRIQTERQIAPAVPAHNCHGLVVRRICTPSDHQGAMS